MTTEEILALVRAERREQDKKWGEQNKSPDRWNTIILEELGESAKAHLENQPDDYVVEMIQAAACCVAAVESIIRQSRGG